MQRYTVGLVRNRVNQFYIERSTTRIARVVSGFETHHCYPYANTLTGIVAVPLVLQDEVGSNPTARFVSVFTYGKVFGGVGKLVTPVDCKSAVL